MIQSNIKLGKVQVPETSPCTGTSIYTGKKTLTMRPLRGSSSSSSRRDKPRSPWRKGTFVILVTCGSWVALRFVARRSMGIMALLAAGRQVPGVPAECGSDGRSTWLWMNPASFNTSFSRARQKRFGGSFLVGCGHSGTTPTVAVIGRHPEVWVYAPNAALEYSVKPNSFRDVPFVPSLKDHQRLRRKAVKSKPTATQWLIKSPSNVCRIGYILQQLPSARIVGLVRDGRDVMLSLRERYPNADPAGPLVLQRWVNDNTALLLYARDPRVLVKRYEDLFHDHHFIDILKHLAIDPYVDIVADQPSSSSSSRRRRLRDKVVVASDAHTQLRTMQTQRPFVRAPPRWPTQMTPHLKRIFKQNHAALHLLVHFSYANSSHRW